MAKDYKASPGIEPRPTEMRAKCVSDYTKDSTPILKWLRPLWGMDNPAFECSELKDRDKNGVCESQQEEDGHKDQNNTSQQPNNLDKEEQQPEREQWDNKREFLLSCISMAVGVGNVWRFPFVALENGGGAFLIPYVFVLIFIGKPMYYLEFIMGQFPSSGSVKVWELSPAFRGVGLGQVFCTWLVVTFYVLLMALCIFYFFASFSSVLPWSICGEWAGPTCVDAAVNSSLNATDSIFSKNNTLSNVHDTAYNMTNSTTIKTSAAEEYFMKEVLHIDYEGFKNGLGIPDWRLVLCLLFSWLTIFVVQSRGVKSSGKVAYFTALFPYLVLFIMLIRGVTLPGAGVGVLYFITPRWEKLLDPRVWYAAVDQAFFSLSIGFGNVIMLASYNRFHNNVYLDATLITAIDSLTCLLAGFTTFAILGHLAELLGVGVEDVVQGGGTALAFISYPDVLARFQAAPQLFSVLFFLMMFTLGLGSAVPYIGVIVTAISDQFPGSSKWWVTLWVCGVSCVLGLLYATPQGQYILTLVNYYAGGVSIILLMVFELIGVVWVYGLRRLTLDIQFMLSRETGWYWKVCWGIFNPIFLAVVFIYSRIIASPLTYGSYVFDDFAIGVGIGMTVIAGLMIPVMYIVEVRNLYTSTSPKLKHALLDVFKPSEQWGPRDNTLRREYYQFIASKNDGLVNVY